MFEKFYEQTYATGVVPVVVLHEVKHAVPLAHALVEGGLPAAEVTFRTPAAAESIATIAREVPQIAVGAGTILNLEQAKQAVDAGAQFIVSPGFDLKTVEWCLEQQIPVVPGAVTPTEIMALRALGLTVSKFFPADVYGGRKAIDGLAAVFGGHRFMPTGGVKQDNLQELLEDPAILAVGGTWMVKPALYADGSFEQVEALTRAAASTVRAVRG